MNFLAYAMGTGGEGGQGGGFGAFIPLILMFGIFYFLLIRPQQKNPSLLEVNLVVVTHALRGSPRAADSKSARNQLKQDAAANRTAAGGSQA